MAIKVLELHHVGFSVPNALEQQMRDFYLDVLALPEDRTRWNIPGVGGFWADVPNGTQIHILGTDGVSPYAKGADQDPVSNHMAVAVEDVQAAEEELTRRGVAYFAMANVASPNLTQLFVRDPAGNLVEIHQKNARRPGVVPAA